MQFFLYSKGDDGDEDSESDADDESAIDEEGTENGSRWPVNWDQKPILERNASDFA